MARFTGRDEVKTYTMLQLTARPHYVTAFSTLWLMAAIRARIVRALLLWAAPTAASDLHSAVRAASTAEADLCPRTMDTGAKLTFFHGAVSSANTLALLATART